MYVPWTGLGLFGGFRGNRWLRNRIKVFKQFVLPSLKAQTSKNFMVWMSWRPEEKHNKIVQEFMGETLSYPFHVFHTFTGICFYDDKYNQQEARARLLDALHGCAAQLMNEIGECEYVLMTIQPSDDCYHMNMVKAVQQVFEETDLEAVGFSKGYIMDYTSKQVAEYNPNTNPPFYTIKFPREVFVNPLKHLEYTGLKANVGQYPKGTPLPSHEYVKDCLKYGQIDSRGFLVGTHGENISTYFNHPFKGQAVSQDMLKDFGLYDIPPIEIKTSIKRQILKRLPFKYQRKLRYWLGERFWQTIYEFLRS
jgi:hypothetical protein